VTKRRGQIRFSLLKISKRFAVLDLQIKNAISQKLRNRVISMFFGGEGGIRTHGSLATTAVFKTAYQLRIILKNTFFRTISLSLDDLISFFI
jgi:hypothetical protein